MRFPRFLVLASALAVVTSPLACGGGITSGSSTGGGGGTTSTTSASGGTGGSGGAAPIALVYRGPAGCDGCSEAVAAALQSSTYAFEVTYVGPNDTALSDALLAQASVYAQPGGDGTVEDAWSFVAADAPKIRAFVQNGGRYLGFCMGGYFAGKSPGFDLLPGDTDEYIASTGAAWTTEADTTLDVVWRGKQRTVYFQDGPFFLVDESATVLATYASNGLNAAVIAPFGQGKVGVVGPHPEATQDWYDAVMLTDADGLDTDLAHDLIDSVLP